MKLILGSSSKYRKQLLEERGYAPEVMAPNVDEKAIRTDDYYKLPLLVARAKLDALVGKVVDPAILVTADVVVVCGGNLYEKPKDVEEARLFLKKYSDGHPAEVISALVVANTQNKKRAEGIDTAKVYFNFLPDNVIDDFIKNGNPFSKAGGFGIQIPILQPYVNKIEGTRECVMGMPTDLLEKLIKEVE